MNTRTWSGRRDKRTWTRFEWVNLDLGNDREAEKRPQDRGLLTASPVRMAQNSLYNVHVYTGDAVPCNSPGDLIYLSVRRLERARLPRDWRDLQRIKNEIVGPEHEGFELFPAESRLVDQSDQFHLWVLARPLRRGEDGSLHNSMGVGWTKRDVSDHGEVEKSGGSQRPFPADPGYHSPPLLQLEVTK